MLALERLGAGVDLILAAHLARIDEQRLDVYDRGVDLSIQSLDVLEQCLSNLRQLGLAPRLLACEDSLALGGLRG
jgi:hypothetical protein